MDTVSILWPAPPERIATVEIADQARRDLEIEAVIAAVIGDRDDYRLAPLLRRPVRDPDTIRFRHQVFTDLDDDEIRAAAEEFTVGMWQVRHRLQVAAGLYHPHQRHRWQLDAAAAYVATITALHAAITRLPLRSPALRRWRDHLGSYCAGPAVRALIRDIDAMRADLARVRYRVRLIDRTLEVSAARSAPDYTATVTVLLARFGAEQPSTTRPVPQWPDMNHMEEQILDRVADRYPGPFARLAEFADRHRDFITAQISEFDRELQFYLRYRRFAHRAAGAHHAICLPTLATGGQPIHATAAFDFALAARTSQPLVCNDFRLTDPERILVVTGPNQGGKTTFARTVGQLIYFAALGGPVPARAAQLPLPDRLCTHFEHGERAEDPDGRLLTDLRAVRAILDAATADTVIVLNESFSTTTTHDGVRIAADVLHRLTRRGVRGVWVSFFDELAEAGPQVVSMVALTEPHDRTRRSFRIVRRPADGNAYATELAEHYGLGYDTVLARLAR